MTQIAEQCLCRIGRHVIMTIADDVVAMLPQLPKIQAENATDADNQVTRSQRQHWDRAAGRPQAQ
jgi:hypothetical protein